VFPLSILFDGNFFSNIVIFTGITALQQHFSYAQSENQKPENNLSFRYAFFRTL